VLGCSISTQTSIANWYDPATNLMHIAPEMIEYRDSAELCVVKENFVFAIGVVRAHSPFAWHQAISKSSVEMLDVSSSSLLWVPIPKVRLLFNQKSFGVGVLDNCIYVVSHANILLILCYKFYILYTKC